MTDLESMNQEGDARFVVGGKIYSANLVQEHNWMVKREEKKSLRYPDGYVEQYLTVETTDPLTAIKAAIEKNSWA